MSIYCAREFNADDIQTIRDLMAHNPKLQHSALSRKLCQLWGWIKPNGELKDMTCRVALLRMQADGLITLPPSRIGVVRKRAHFAPTAASDAQTPSSNPCTKSGVSRFKWSAQRPHQGCGTNMSRVTTIWATRPCQAARFVTTSLLARNSWPASVSAHAPGSSRTGRNSSAGVKSSGKKTCNW